MEDFRESNKPHSMREILEETDRVQEAFLGFEYDPETEEENEHPYDVDDIRIVQKMISVFQVCTWIERGTLDLRPDFQRNLIWNKQRRSLLIESLMLRIPIPAFYLDEDKEEKRTVIDGLQRLSTIYDFVHGKFKLYGLQYLHNCEGKYFDEIGRKYKERIEDTQLAVNILDSRCPDMVKFEVFRRVNTGGVPLNAQEIRNVLSNKAVKDLLDGMATCPEFLEATRGRVSDVRMGAQELCLRFIAFYKIYDENDNSIKNYSSMAVILDRTILELNGEPERHQYYLNRFRESMHKNHILLGSYAFSKSNLKYMVNRPLFTAFSVLMAYDNHTDQELMESSRRVIDNLEKCFSIPQYYTAISTSTGSRSNIETQFRMVRTIIKEIDND